MTASPIATREPISGSRSALPHGAKTLVNEVTLVLAPHSVGMALPGTFCWLPGFFAVGRSDRPAGRKGVKRWRGTVYCFNEQKGYAFISGEPGDDVFVHFSAMQGTGFKTLREGDASSSMLAPGEKGDEARNVRQISSPVAVGLAAGPAGLDARLAARRGR